jgi:hypothetical protein
MNPNCTYNDKVGFIPIPSPDPVSTGINVAQLVIEAGIALAPIAIKWAKNAFAHPARDARDFIKNAKPTIVNIDPNDRLVKVIAYAQKISDKAIDVNAKEWILWYRQAYRDDYMSLTPEAKIYWNNFLYGIKTAFNNPNNMNADLDLAIFSQREIDYNATPVESVTNLVSNLTAPGSNVKYVLYGGISLLFVYLLSSKK